MNTVRLPHQVNDSLPWHLDAYPQSVLEKYTWTSLHTIDYLIVPEYDTITVEDVDEQV